MSQILLCTDLDRTLLPNGTEPESPGARPLFRRLVARPEVTLAYVTGRHRALIEQAIEDYDVPVPDFAVGDVGSTIYRISGGSWQSIDAWHREIAPDWGALGHDDLARVVGDHPGLRVQEAAKQNTFKLSYDVSPEVDRRALHEVIEERLRAAGVHAAIVWSTDAGRDVGLLDVLPASATKLHAIRFLMRMLGLGPDDAVFAGDSGNDLSVLTSGLQAVLVRNAGDDVRAEVLRAIEHGDPGGCEGRRRRVFIARGGFLGLNGHYAAGVLEGLAHFRPETRAWMETP